MSRSFLRSPRIGVTPFTVSDNAYIERMKEIMGEFGDVVPFPTAREFFFRPTALFLGKFDFVVLNWIESRVIDKTGKFSWLRAAALFGYLFAAKLCVRQIVWVRHNNYPHGTAGGSVARLKRLLVLIERFSDVVVTHSGHNVQGGRCYVPHPLYKRTSLEEVSLPFKDYYLIFGRMLPYKRLHEAIESIPSDVQLVIAGPCPDKQYLDHCKKLAEGRANVLILPGYMSESKAHSIAMRSKGVIVLNSDEDMVVSGNYLFALSLGVPVFTVQNPFIDWLVYTKEMPGIRSFSSVSALLASLLQTCDFIEPNPALIETEFGDFAVARALEKVLRLSDG